MNIANTNTNQNVTNLIDRFVAEMAEQGTLLAEKLKQLDEAYKRERADLAAQLASVDRAMAAMKSKATTQAGIAFKPTRSMSPEGRANIAAALKARRERLAAEAAGKPEETAAVAEPATEEQNAPPEAAVETVVEPVAEVAAEPVVKTTALERDALVNGIYRNNFNDNGGNSVWSNQIIDNGSCKVLTAKQLPGVITSLVKKGLAVSDGEAVTLTEAGLKLAKELADAAA